MSAPAPGGSPSPPADSPVPPPPSTGTPASPPPSSAPPPAPSPPSSSTPDPPPPSNTPASPPPSIAPPAPSPSSRSTPDPSPSAPPAVPAAQPQKPAPPPVTPATPPASSPPTQAPVTPATPPASSPPPQAPVTPATPLASSPPPQAPVTPAAPPASSPPPQAPVTPAAPPASSPPPQAPVMPAAPPASSPPPQPPVTPAAPPASSPPPQPPVTPAAPPASSPPLQPPAAPPPPPAAPLPTPLPPPPVTPAPSTPSPSPPVTPAPSTPSPSPPVTPAPSTPSPSPPAPAAPFPPSPVTPAPPTPSPPSPVKPTPPTPSPPSPAGPGPTTPPSPVPPVAPPPTTPSPPPPDAPEAPIPSPTPPSTAPPSPPAPAPPGVSPSPPSGAPPSPPSPPSRSTPSPSPPSVSPPSLSSSSSPSSSPSPSTPSGTVIIVAVAVAAAVVLGLVAGLICFCAGKRRHRQRRRPPPGDLYDPGMPGTSHQQSHPRPTSAPLSATPPVYSPQVFTSWQVSGGSDPTPRSPAVTGGTVSYDDLAAATGGFSDANLLGQGGFGHVYRGTLGGQEVAIKKLRPGSGQGDREFRAEVEIIGRVHHRHLVSLVGYCIYGDQRLLVYEYVPNKTLEFHLHGSGRPTLDWTRRWKIALGSAKGLAYLHEDCHPKIIHRDIKAANILLDYNFEPKVADFGLAKIQPGDDTHVSTRVVGTFGYLAPEYATTGKVNDRSDVFSFGVVLLELISGRRPVMSTEPYNDETLVSWARPLLTKALVEEIFDELIDPELDAGYDAYDMQRLIACAAAAVRHTARSRPRMSQIVRYLEGELSIEDLNAGVAPGQSAMQSSGGTTEQMRRLRRMAFLAGTGTITENTSSSFLSEPTSEYGLYPSSSSSGGDTGEVDTQRTSRPHTGSSTASAEGTGPHSGEPSAAERMSRRTRPARAALP